MFNQISIWCLHKHICTHNTGNRKQILVTHLIAWRNVSCSRTGSKCPVPSPLLSATVLQARRSTNSSGSNGSCTKSKDKQRPQKLRTTLYFTDHQHTQIYYPLLAKFMFHSRLLDSWNNNKPNKLQFPNQLQNSALWFRIGVPLFIVIHIRTY